MDILLILAVYTVLVLLFAPLELIGKWQSSVRKWVKKLGDKV